MRIVHVQLVRKKERCNLVYDCVFVYLNIIEDYFTGAEYQIDSAYIRMYLEKEGYQTVQYINQRSQSIQEYEHQLCKYDTKYYAFYINEYNYSITRIVMHGLKQRPYGIIIFGPSASYIANHLYGDLEFDYVALKHEHIVFKEIFENRSLCDIKNFGYRNNVSICMNEEQHYIYSLDDLGLPYNEGYIPVQEAMNVGMITSKGCYGKCSFCSYNTSENNFYSHSVENVIKELDYVYQYVGGYNNIIRFYDDCFSLNRERTIRLLKEIEKRKYVLRFWCCTRADLITKDIVDLFKVCNFYQTIIGLETASASVMKCLGKTQGDAQTYIKRVLDVYQYAKSIECNLNFSINFGLPGETLEDADKTVDFVVSNGAQTDASVCFMTAFPGSKVFECSESYHVIKEESPARLPYRTYYRQYSMCKIFDDLYHANVYKESTDRIRKNVAFIFHRAYTGIYIDDSSSHTIDTIFVDELDEAALSFIHGNVKLNGDVAMIKDKININPVAFCEDRKRLRIGIEEYDRYMKSAHNYQCYFPNMNFVKETDKSIYIQRRNYYLPQPIKAPIQLVQSLSDLDYYNERAKRFHMDHKITVKDIQETNIKNLCRLSGRCSVAHLRSVKVADRKVYPQCSDVAIGTLGDDYSTCASEIIVKKQTMLKQRGCETCNIASWCSKCLFPSELFKSEIEYCEYMRNHIELLRYFRIVTRMSDYFNCTNFYATEEFIVHLLNGNQKIMEQYKIKEEMFVVFWKDDIFILSLTSASVTVCNVLERKVIRKIIYHDSVSLQDSGILSLIKKGVLLPINKD